MNNNENIGFSEIYQGKLDNIDQVTFYDRTGNGQEFVISAYCDVESKS
ncbi:hypothetical protein [Paenibacillus sp. SN-8-1]